MREQLVESSMRRRGVRIPLYITTLVLLLLLSTTIVACSGGGSSTAGGAATISAGGTAGAGGGGGGIPGALPPTVTPTTSIASPGTGEGGIAEFCSGPADIESALPASIPPYPNAQIRVSKISGGNGLFGLCTADSTSKVVSYYLSQLPSKGWQQIAQNTILEAAQIQATRGSGYITITIQPDGRLSSTTDIIIQTSGVS
jgi:hypothetical protein